MALLLLPLPRNPHITSLKLLPGLAASNARRDPGAPGQCARDSALRSPARYDRTTLAPPRRMQSVRFLADSPWATAFCTAGCPAARSQPWPRSSIQFSWLRSTLVRPPQRSLRAAPEESNRGEGVDRDREGAGREQAARIDRRREE